MKTTPPCTGEQPPANAAKRRRIRARRAATAEQALLTVPQAAVFLGWTERATWQAAYRGTIPARRLGKKVFVLREELLSFLKACSHLSPEGGAARGE